MKILEPTLNKELTQINAVTFDDEMETIEDSLIENISISVSIKNLSVAGSRIDKSDFTNATLEGLGFNNVIIKDCTMTAGNFSESSWHRTAIINSRCSGMQLDKSRLRDVIFRGCKLDIVNLRYAKLTNVLFESCIVDEMDFYGAELKNVRFVDCNINNLEFQRTTLQKVDFRESNLAQVKLPTDLKGAIINSQQLIFLSPQLAVQAGIIVED